MDKSSTFSQRSSELVGAYKPKPNDILSFFYAGDNINVFGETIYKLVCDKEWSSLILNYDEQCDCVYIELKGRENRHE